MTRVSYGDDSDEDGRRQLNLWNGVETRQLRSKQGQALLRELRAALLAMPEKKLAHDRVLGPPGTPEAGCGCAGGELVAARLVRAGKTRDEALVELKKFDDAVLYDGEMFERLHSDHGIQRTIAWRIVECNDRFPNETPEERHARVLRWCEEHIIGLDSNGATP